MKYLFQIVSFSNKSILTVKLDLKSCFLAHVSINAIKSEIKIIDDSCNCYM